MKHMTISSVALGAMLLGGAASANAAVEIQTQGYGPTDVGSADMSSLDFNKFDTSLGTLTDIVITLTSNNSLSSSIVNLGAAASFQSAQVTSTIVIAGQDGAVTTDPLNTLPYDGSIGAGTFSAPTLSTGTSVHDTASDVAHVNSANFGGYEAAGGGVLSYLLDASISAVSSGASKSSLVFFGYQATSVGTVEIDYDYTPNLSAVPEAGTMMAGLFALGFGFFSVCRQRCRVDSSQPE